MQRGHSLTWTCWWDRHFRRSLPWRRFVLNSMRGFESSASGPNGGRQRPRRSVDVAALSARGAAKHGGCGTTGITDTPRETNWRTKEVCLVSRLGEVDVRERVQRGQVKVSRTPGYTRAAVFLGWSCDGPYPGQKHVGREHEITVVVQGEWHDCQAISCPQKKNIGAFSDRGYELDILASAGLPLWRQFLAGLPNWPCSNQHYLTLSGAPPTTLTRDSGSSSVGGSSTRTSSPMSATGRPHRAGTLQPTVTNSRSMYCTHCVLRYLDLKVVLLTT